MKKLKNFTIEEEVFPEVYRKKNIAFFNLIDNRKFTDVYYVTDEENQSDKISIITMKNSLPMSMPVDMFNEAINVNINSENLCSSEVEGIFGKHIIHIEKRKFARKIKYEKIVNDTKAFWDKFYRTDSIASLIYLLQDGNKLALENVHGIGRKVPKVQLKLEGDMFYLVKLIVKDDTYKEILISPKEAVSYMINYLIEKNDMQDPDFKNFISEIYIN